MLIGARIVKTGLAVTISMFICYIFDIQPAIFAGAATVLNMQPSVGLSLYNAREQVIVHFISIAIAVLLGLALGTNPLVMGLATIIIIRICKYFKWRGGISPGVMASLFILASPSNQFIDHALVRSLAIFIGVGVALLVNLTIAPPRYRQPLKQKLTELNSLTSRYFYEAVQSYLQLNIPSPDEQEERTKTIESLFRESRHLYDLYRFDIGPHTENPKNKEEKESKYYNEYITYDKGLWQRTRDILFLAQERKDRRAKAGDKPISPEFNEILELLEDALKLYMEHSGNLNEKLEGKEIIPPVEEPRIWRKFNPILAHWYDRLPSDSYYLHALIEVALVIYKIRWAARETVRLLNSGE